MSLPESNEMSLKLSRFPEDSGNEPYAGAKLNSAGSLGFWRPLPAYPQNYVLEIKHLEKDLRPILIFFEKVENSDKYRAKQMAWLEPLHTETPITGTGEINHRYSRSDWIPVENEFVPPYEANRAPLIGGESIQLVIEGGKLRMDWI